MYEPVGFRIYTAVDRPEKERVALLDGIPGCYLTDFMNRSYCMRPYIRPQTDHYMIGTAITVKAPMGDNLMIHKAIDLAQEGDVIVVDGEGGTDRSVVGEMMVRRAAEKGIRGIVVDGMTRDAAGIRKAGIAVFSRGSTMKGSNRNGPGEINVPISCGGLAVLPGDVVIGDADGVVIVRKDDIEQIAEQARAKFEREKEKVANIEAGGKIGGDRSWIDKSLTEKGITII